MTKKQKAAALLGRMAAAPALFLLMLGAGSLTAYAAGYDLYIGSTQVTDANAGNILGDGTASYDAGTKTLTLNGVHIGADNYYEYLYSGYDRESHTVDRYSLYAGEDVVKHLVINGENSFESAMADVVYFYNAAEVDEDYWAVDVTGDGEITLDDATVETAIGKNGIYFSVSRPGGQWTDQSLMITGTGKLTSTSTTPTTPNECRVYDEYGFDSHGVVPVPLENTVNTGTALTVEGGGGVYIGNEDGTGPRLELTGWDKGANFVQCGRFVMQGGTVIAKATSEEQGIGVYLASHGDGERNFFEGGTIAAYGKYKEYGSGAFSDSTGWFDQPKSEEHGMKRVYPKFGTFEGETSDIYSSYKLMNISGWCVAGMTADAYKAQTDAVLAELSLDPDNPTDPSGTGEGGGTNPGTDPTNPGGEGGGTTPSTGEGNSYHTDAVPDPGVEIDVQGITKAATVYSVDVEWGAMTFQYEKSSWDAVNHTSKPGRGWLVYDSVNDAVVDGTQEAINCITVTNHSNADVFATLSYTGNDSYGDITGDFTKKADDTVTKFTGKAAATPAYLTLDSADNDKGEGEGVGKETVGKAYFLPSGIGKTGDTVNDISQWTKIGKITVGLLTEEP